MAKYSLLDRLHPLRCSRFRSYWKQWKPVIPSFSSSEATVVEDSNRIVDVPDRVRILQKRSQEHKLLLIHVAHEVMDEPCRLVDHSELVHCMAIGSIWNCRHETWATYRSLIDCCSALDVNDPTDNSVHSSMEPEVGLQLVVSCRYFLSS